MDERPVIAVLAPAVANQIAAGEVVERPASVLKELVENAIDAGARTITVVVDGGGVARIAVTDDGWGMLPDEIALSVLRHATSKIRTAEDLVGVHTYGFRGEALASIGSVARLRITSRVAERDEGAEVVVEGGVEQPVKPWGGAVGTTVSVEELFANVPARRKFLRTAATEQAQCFEVVSRLALPRPEVRFVVRRDGKTVREYLRRTDLGERVREVYPDEQLATLEGTRGAVKVRAFLGPPERARTGGNALALYVNGRHVRDRTLMRAVAQAYGNVLDNGRYPVGALLLDVPPADVDVNVHPQKNEVRFAAANEVFSAVSSIVRTALESAPWARAVAIGRDYFAGRFAGGPVASTSTEAPRTPSHEQHGARASTPSAPAVSQPPTPTATPTPALQGAGAREVDPWGLTPAGAAVAAAYTLALPLAPGRLASNTHADEPAAEEARGEFGSLRFVAQMRKMFLVCESDDAMVVLDQHAAAERVTFERLRKGYEARTVAVQPLLVPVTIAATPREIALVEQGMDELARMGVELAVAGPNSIAVRAMPAILARLDPARAARDVIDELARSGNDFTRARDLVLATMACHGSVRAGDTVSDEEARALLRALDVTSFAGHCPHGRPIVWSMRFSELERKVGR